ncbi:hypothetical protein BDV27DRAFT_122191 [Aspergillus caelatus]|uniref:Hydrophobin n=1 Tax=Aspergillus caelatus TaxID=61420 RepID=A0A5N7AF95_9EURO|nr:uncharacterized protein BDV27DRAFT_122191 [Aspergillus caelatus]KAE8368534.1 hypothetical protein BDV27DRAFT_122191 [Aspergillus caelatus]
MKFTVAAVLGFAITALAVPSANQGAGQPKITQISYHEAKGQCTTGDIYCCNNKHDEKTGGLLNLLNDGLIKNLDGQSDSSCASTSLIKELNLLSFATHGKDDKDSFCKNVIACCPAGGKCEAISK